MAGFTQKTFLKHDDYMTPENAWQNIKNYLPKDKVIYEPFYGDGNSGLFLRNLGIEVIHEAIDFFETSDRMSEILNKCDIIVSNPPFSIKKKVFTKLKELGKPFIMICPSSMINTKYMRELFSADDENPLQIMIPPSRINFIKKINGKVPEGWGNRCNFDCFYYCWQMNLTKDIIWLKHDDETS
jgi:uncharacterized protein YutD